MRENVGLIGMKEERQETSCFSMRGCVPLWVRKITKQVCYFWQMLTLIKRINSFLTSHPSLSHNMSNSHGEIERKRKKPQQHHPHPASPFPGTQTLHQSSAWAENTSNAVWGWRERPACSGGMLGADDGVRVKVYFHFCSQFGIAPTL